jgi:hypothetical protein
MQLLSYIALTLFLSTAAFAQTRTVEGKATGRIYNEIKKGWVPVSVEMYVDDESNFYAVVVRPTAQARGMLPKDCLPVFIAALEKAKEWARKAKADEIEITKSLGDFATPRGEIIHDVKLNFFSAQKGKQADVILTVIDFDNRYKTAETYIAIEDIEPLILMLKKVPVTHEELLVQKKKSDDFK